MTKSSMKSGLPTCRVDGTIVDDQRACKNTDREIWRGPYEGNGSYYADSIHVTEGGGIGMNCGGYVIVMPLRKWHRAAKLLDFASELEASINEPKAWPASEWDGLSRCGLCGEVHSPTTSCQ